MIAQAQDAMYYDWPSQAVAVAHFACVSNVIAFDNVCQCDILN